MTDLVIHLAQSTAAHDIPGQRVDFAPLCEYDFAILKNVELEATDEVEGTATCEVVFVDLEMVIEELVGLRSCQGSARNLRKDCQHIAA
jgi:hypothetical protein